LRSLMGKTDQYKITPRDIPLICNAASLHDIGKITIPSKILNKPGRLTDEEFAVMKTHAAEGARMLQDIAMREDEPLVKVAYQICRWHHERYDGRGYPDGLKGEEIPIAAQVVAMADVYDALTSDRVYKKAFSHKKTMEMILNGECGTFNPLLLECLADISDTLEKGLNAAQPSGNTQEEMIDMVEDLMGQGTMDASERTLRLLEHERTRYQFFSELSQEIQFEYTAVPEMMILSEWGAKYLHMPETILNPREDAFGKRVFAENDFSDFLEKLEQTTPASPVVESNFLLKINGQDRWSKVIARSMWVDGEPPVYSGAIGKIVDIHEDMEKLNRLEVMADHDSLTGLYNHRAAKARIMPLLSGKREGDQNYILVLFDLDHFKQANDQYGHQFGDEVLKYVSNTVKTGIRGADIAARTGGDEFLIFMEYKTVIEPQVKRIFELLCGAYGEFTISVSMGVANAKDCRGDYESLFQRADQALYAAKRGGRGRYCFYDDIAKIE